MSNNDKKVEDVAWAAGFFEGEGHINVQIRGGKSYIAAVVSQVYREPLDKLEKVFGGKVRGPYGPYSGNRRPHYQWSAYGSSALNFLNDIMPYLYRKGDQARVAIDKWENYYNES